MLRALRQAFAAGNARGCRVAALHRRHRDGIVRHCPLLVAVQEVVVITGANKSSYIDSFLDRSLNATEVAQGINMALHGDERYSWFID